MFKLVVLSCVLAAATASTLSLFGREISPIYPLGYGAPWYQPYNYRGPLSLAPGQPADIIASDGRPLDTLDVNLDRAAQYNSKAVGHAFHIIKKRSVAVVAPYSSAILPYTAPFASYAAPLAYSAPLLQPYNYRGPLSLAPGQPANILGSDGRPLDTLDVNLDRAAHLTAKALSGEHILKKRSVAAIAPISTIAVARTPLIASSYAYPTTFATTHFNPISYAATPIAHIL